MMFKQEGVLYRHTGCNDYGYYYSKRRGDYVSFGVLADTKIAMRNTDFDNSIWYGDKPEEIEPHLVPLTFAQQAAIITDGCQ